MSKLIAILFNEIKMPITLGMIITFFFENIRVNSGAIDSVSHYRDMEAN
jgi:hypothetical protein